MVSLVMETMNLPPRTIMEVFKMLPEGTLAELIDGNLYMSPSPTANHQSIVLGLASTINDFVESQNLGKVFIAPFDVFLDELANAVQPDILFVAQERLSIVKPDAVHGVPDLIIEVLSPGNPKYDLIGKKDLYEHFRVKEYWVIDPDTKQSTGFFLDGNTYGPAVSNQARIISRTLHQAFSY